MKDLDFRVGDEVCSILHGNGKVTSDIITLEKYPICVYFQSGNIGRFTKDGKQLVTDQVRTLYHGHDLNITIDEKKPIRHRWPNIYKHKDTYTMSVDHTS